MGALVLKNEKCIYCETDITLNYILNKMNHTTEVIKCPLCRGEMICTMWIETTYTKRFKLREMVRDDDEKNE